MKDKLLKLLQDNPDLPIKFMVSSETDPDYSYNIMEKFDCEVLTLYYCDELILTSYEDAYDHILGIEQYKEELPDQQMKEHVKELVSKLKQEKCIVLWIDHDFSKLTL